MSSTTAPGRAERAAVVAVSTLRTRTAGAVALTIFTALLVVDGFDALTDPSGRYLGGLTFTCAVGIVAVLLALPGVWMTAAALATTVVTWLVMHAALADVP